MLLFFVVSSECEDFVKFAEDSDSHIFEEKLEDSFKKREIEALTQSPKHYQKPKEILTPN